MFLARLGAGLGQSAQLPVSAPLLVDTYPIAGARRGLRGARRRAGGRHDARAVPRRRDRRARRRRERLAVGVLRCSASSRCRSRCPPPRSRNRGGAGTRCSRCSARSSHPRSDELPISLSVAFERLRKIQSFYYFLVGMAALGFALFTSPLFLNLYFDDELGLDAFERGVVATIIAIPTFVAIAIAGRRADALFRRSPPAAMAFVGLLVALFGVGLVVAIWLPSIWAVVPVLALATACAQAAFTILPAVVSTIIPYRLRARGTAMIGIYVFLFGSFFGAVLTGMLSRRVRDAHRARDHRAAVDAHRRRADRARCAPHSPRHDDGRRRAPRGAGRARRGCKPPNAVLPVIQVRNLDFSYGKVQVLFDVELRRLRRRDARAARNERRRQVDAAAGHQRARCRRTRRDPAARPHGDVCGSGTARARRHRAAHRRRRDVPAAHRATRTCGPPPSCTAVASRNAASTRPSSCSPSSATASTRRRRSSPAASSRCSRWR